jgi:hypothetical protein
MCGPRRCDGRSLHSSSSISISTTGEATSCSWVNVVRDAAERAYTSRGRRKRLGHESWSGGTDFRLPLMHERYS